MSYNYTKLKNKSHELIAKYGRMAILVRLTRETDENHPSRKPSTQKEFFPTICLFLDYVESDDEGTQVKGATQRILAAPWETDINEKLNSEWEVWDGVSRYAVLNAETVKPGNTILMYDLACRGAGALGLLTYGDSFNRGREVPLSGNGMWTYVPELSFLGVNSFNGEGHVARMPAGSNGAFLVNDSDNFPVSNNQFMEIDVSLDAPQGSFSVSDVITFVVRADISPGPLITFTGLTVSFLTGRVTLTEGVFFGTTRYVYSEENSVSLAEQSTKLRDFPLNIRLEASDDRTKVFINGCLVISSFNTTFKEQKLIGASVNTLGASIDNVVFGDVEPAIGDTLPVDTTDTTVPFIENENFINLIKSPYELTSLDWIPKAWQNQALSTSVSGPWGGNNAVRVVCLRPGVTQGVELSQQASLVNTDGSIVLHFFLKRAEITEFQTTEFSFNLDLTGGTPINRAVTIDLDDFTTVDTDTTISNIDKTDWYEIRHTLENNDTGNDTVDMTLIFENVAEVVPGKFVDIFSPALYEAP